MDPTLTFGWRPWVTLIVFAFSLLFVVRPVSIPLRFLQQEFRWCRNRSSPLLFPLDFSTAPLIAVIILSIIGSLSVNVLSVGIVGDGVTLIPYAICLLFFSLSYICLSLDLTGCFAYLATKAASLGGTSKPRTLLIFFGLASLVTLLTSNDIVVRRNLL